jgi:trimeric autotransporter adhesin
MGCHSEVAPANGSATSTLALTPSAGATTGNATVTVTGISGALTDSTTIALTVKFVRGIADGGLRSTLKAPKCLNAGSGCDSGPSLLLGRDTMSGGAEPNQPNTINDSCAEGTSGTFRRHAGTDHEGRVKHSSMDTGDVRPDDKGQTIRV